MSNIIDRSNGQIIDETWFNILKTEIEQNEQQITLHGTNLVIPWWLNGSYAYDGPRTGLLWYFAKQSITLLSCQLFCRKAGASGSTTIDIQVSTNGGSSFASIFTTKPSVPTSGGDYADSVTDGTPAVLDSSKVLIAANNILRFDITGVMLGTALAATEPKDLFVNLVYKVTGAVLE